MTGGRFGVDLGASSMAPTESDTPDGHTFPFLVRVILVCESDKTRGPDENGVSAFRRSANSRRRTSSSKKTSGSIFTGGRKDHKEISSLRNTIPLSLCKRQSEFERMKQRKRRGSGLGFQGRSRSID
jgi:hypothetical protein